MTKEEKEERRIVVNSLIARLKEKDIQALVELNDIMWKPICDFLEVACHNIHSAMELTQKTFQKVLILAKLGKVKIENCPSWMIGIANNLLHNYLRKHKREVQVEDTFMETKLTCDNIYEQVHMKMALEKLPLKELQVFVFNLQGYTYNEIGSMLKISESTVKRIKSKAQNALKKEYEL